MRKIVIIIIFNLLFLCNCSIKSHKEENNQLIHIKKELQEFSIEDKNVSVYLPLMENEEVNCFINYEINEVIKKIIHKYPLGDNIAADFEYRVSEEYLCYDYSFDIIKKDKTIGKIKKVYNINYKENKVVFIANEQLWEKYLTLINKRLEEEKIKINYYEVLSLPYIINSDKVVFLILVDDKTKEYMEIIIDNVGVTNVDIASYNNKVNYRYQVVLSFDDGPSIMTDDLLSLLNKYNIKATFFVLGSNVEKMPHTFKNIVSNNHEIGNHSYSHPDFTKISVNEALLEIDKTQNIIFNLCGFYPQIFRFPYGANNQTLLNIVTLPIIFWNVDSLDWRRLSLKETLNIIETSLTEKSIILFHDHFNLDLVLIEEAIKSLINKGYSFISITEMFELYVEENYIPARIYE